MDFLRLSLTTITPLENASNAAKDNDGFQVTVGLNGGVGKMTQSDQDARAFVECTCNRCGWVHFAMSRERAQSEVDQFNAYYEALSPEKREKYYGNKPASIATYERCFFCGQTDGDFRPYQDGDCPTGCTIQPVIWDSPTESGDKSHTPNDL